MTPDERLDKIWQDWMKDDGEFRALFRGAIRAAVVEEREACAKICDSVPIGAEPRWVAEECARRIRARGAKP